MTEYLYECIRCDKKFINKIDLERHLNKVDLCKPILNNFFLTNEEVKKISNIKISKKKFYEKKDIPKEKDLICKYCFSNYKSKSLLNAHIKICNLKNDYIHIINIFEKIKMIKDNKLNFIKINNIKNFDDDYVSDYLANEIKSFVILRLEPYFVLDKIMLDKRNLNIMPINENMSCIILNNEVKKINNIFLEEILTFKLKRFMLELLKDFRTSKIITEKVFVFLKNEIETMLNNTYYGLIDKIRINLKKISIVNLHHFIPNNQIILDFNDYDKFINYYENNYVDYILELYGFIDKNVFNYDKGVQFYSNKGGFLICPEIWEIKENKNYASNIEEYNKKLKIKQSLELNDLNNIDTDKTILSLNYLSDNNSSDNESNENIFSDFKSSDNESNDYKSSDSESSLNLSKNNKKTSKKQKQKQNKNKYFF